MTNPMRDLTQTIATLQAASAAHSWGAAITARPERIKGINRTLKGLEP